MKKFITKNKIIIILFLIILFGAFLRLYQFENMLRFNADQARDARVVDKMFAEKEYPLLGPKAGGTAFKLGPAFYYLQYLSAAAFGRDLAGMAFLTVLAGIFSIPLLFILLRFYFSENNSLILTFLYAVSFYAVKYSKFAWNPNFIPFFMLAFLIVLIKITQGKKPFLWNILAGIIIGIGVQLHTLLIILMPALFFSVHIYLLVKRKRKHMAGLLAAVIIVLIFNLPLLVYDFQTGGENIRAFLAGVKQKTGDNYSFSATIFQAGQFFLQGNFYALTGYEPKNWMNTRKMISARDFSEMAVAVAAFLFFLLGFALVIRNLLKEKDGERKIFLGIIALSLIFSLLIFWPLSGELNIRFFIALIFLPFVFLGVVLEYFKSNFKKEIFYPLATLAVSALAFYNLNIWRDTYNPRIFSGKSDTYGGISLDEARGLSKFMRETRSDEKFSENRFFLQPFEFSRSVDYFNEKAALEISSYSENKALPGDIVFAVVKNKNAPKAIETQKDSFLLLNSRDIGRFTILVFKKQN